MLRVLELFTEDIEDLVYDRNIYTHINSSDPLSAHFSLLSGPGISQELDGAQ